MTQTVLMHPSMPYKLVGMSGYAQSGKDTVGQILHDQHGFRRLAFADSLRELALKIDPFVPLPHETIIPEGWQTLSGLVQHVGWEEAKTSGEVRRFLQDLGTGCREVIDPDCWIKPVLRQIKSDRNFPTVITDVRFPNEAKMIKQLGGVVWRISRPGYGAVNAHLSERSMDSWAFDHFLINDSSITELSHFVNEALGAS